MLDLLTGLLLEHLSIVVGFLLAVVGIGAIVRQRRSSQATAAWLLAIVLVPYVGVPLYLLLGGRKTRKAAEGKQKLHLVMKETVPLDQASGADRLFRSYGLPGATAGNRIRLLPTGEENYACLMEHIEAARESINILTFILGDDPVGRSVVQALARKAAAGVQVRLLLDGVGSFETGKRLLKPLRKAGGKVAWFVPLIHRPFRGRNNLRNHRKITLFDECFALAGGTNIAREYMGPTPMPGRWKDLAFALEGPAVDHYAEIFRSDWRFAAKEDIELHPERDEAVPGGVLAQVVPSGPDVAGDPLYDAILTALYTAERRLWLVTPYFVPDEALASGFRAAARRGIDLRILVPERSNHRLADYARGTYLREIQDLGGKVLLYEPGMVHAKAALIDHDIVAIGSANLDLRSFFLNYEVALFAYGPQVVADTEAWMEGLFARCRDRMPAPGTFRDTLEGLVRLVDPLL